MRLNITRRLKRFISSKLGVCLELGKYKVGDVCLETPCEISQASDLNGNFSAGAFTTISPTDSVGHLLHNVTIGRYCSIAAGVWISPHEHPLGRLTPHALTYGGYTWIERFMGHTWKAKADMNTISRPVTIGNDVWIGSNAFIRGG